jgi:hypothetical protein
VVGARTAPSAIGDAGATTGAIDLVKIVDGQSVRDITAATGDAADWPGLTAAVEAIGR